MATALCRQLNGKSGLTEELPLLRIYASGHSKDKRLF